MARFIACPECDADVPARARQGRLRCPECDAPIRRGNSDEKSGTPWTLILGVGGGILVLATVVVLVVVLSNSKQGGNAAAEVVPPSGRPPAGWREIKRPDFSVWMAERDETVPLKIDQFGGASRMVTLPDTSVVLDLHSTVLEPGKAARSESDPVWAYEQLIQIGLDGKRITSRQDFKMGGRLGRDYVLSDRNGGQFHTRMIVVKGTVYILSAAGPGITAANPDVRLFFDSLRVTAGS